MIWNCLIFCHCLQLVINPVIFVCSTCSGLDKIFIGYSSCWCVDRRWLFYGLLILLAVTIFKWMLQYDHWIGDWLIAIDLLSSPNSDLHALSDAYSIMHLGPPSAFSYFTGGHAAPCYHGTTPCPRPIKLQGSQLTRQIYNILRVNNTAWWVANMLKIALTTCACSRYPEESCVNGRKSVIRSVYQYAYCDSEWSYIYAVARVMLGSIVPMTSRVARQRCAGSNGTLYSLYRARCRPPYIGIYSSVP